MNTLFLVLLLTLQVCYCHSRDGPRIENLTESEIKYAWLYWEYNTTDRAVRAGRRADTETRPLKLGYRFLVPLPERLAGISYVGHAARLRLALERARRGEALRVGAVGGSITAGQAVGGDLETYAAKFVEWLNAALPPKQPGQDDDEGQQDPQQQSGGEDADRRDEQPAEDELLEDAADAGDDHVGTSEGLVRDPPGTQDDMVPQGFASGTGQEGGLGKRQIVQRESPQHVRGTDPHATRLPSLQRRWLGTLQQQQQQASTLLLTPWQRRTLRGAAHQRSLKQEGSIRGKGQWVESQARRPEADQLQRPLLLQWSEVTRRALFQAPLRLLPTQQRPEPQAADAGDGSLTADTRPQIQQPANAAISGRRAATGRRRAQEQQQLPGPGLGPVAPGPVPVKPPPRRHQYINGAVPGTMSGYASSCLDHHMPRAGTDIVLVEYSVNDSPVPSWDHSDPGRRAMERLVRKLLNRPSRPAVLIVNMFAYKAAKGKYWHNAERDFTELATYYSLPSVSLKAAVMPPSCTETGEPAAPAVSLGAIYNGGVHHPGRGGHVVVAEVLITLALELLHSSSHMHEGRPASRLHRGGLGEAMDTTLQEALEAVAARPLPRPLSNGNYESANNTCYLGVGLKGLVLPPVAGWTWTDEGRGKWGWVATEVEQVLRIKVNTRLHGNRSEEALSAKVVVQIAFLQSYSGMGTALVECASGCSCEPRTMDGFNARPVSITEMEDLRVSQHPECAMTLTTKGPSPAGQAAGLAGAASEGQAAGLAGVASEGAAPGVPAPAVSAGNKFKLMGVVVGEEPGAREGTVTWVRPETFDMSQRLRHGAG